MKKLAIVLFLLAAAAAAAATAAGDCQIRRVVVAPVQAQAPVRYYYSNGAYYRYTGGSHGQLYYRDGGHYYRDGHHYGDRETVVLVPKAIQVEVQRDHYYSIDPAIQQSLLVDAIVGRLLRMQAETAPAGKREATGTGRLPTGPAAKTSPTGDGGLGAQEPKAGDYQNEALLKVVTNSCAKCHGSASKYTRLVTADGKLNDLPAGKVWECFGLVNSGEMPKGGKSLTDDEVKLFYDWAKNARR